MSVTLRLFALSQGEERLVIGGPQPVLAPERLVKERPAEIGKVGIIRAAEGRLVSRCCRNDERGRRLEIPDKATGITVLEHNDRSANATVVEYTA